MEKHSDEKHMERKGNADNFVYTMNHFMTTMLTPSLQVAMNQLSNHDHSRFLTRTNAKVGRVEHLGSQAAEEGVNHAIMREAVVMQMTWVGAPTIYYGDEVSVCGFTDPDSRRSFPWGHEDQEMLAFHKDIIRIHKSEKPLRKGSFRMLHWEEHILAYARFEGDEQVVVVINNDYKLREVTIPVWMAEVPMNARMERLLYSYDKGYTTGWDQYLVQDGEIVVNMGAYSALVMRTRKD
jgi:alpha-glucosidase